MSSQTDVSAITEAVAEIQIEGPGAPSEENGNTVEFITSEGSSGPIPVSALAPVADDALFDSHAYVDVPVMDGQATDRLSVSFGGTISFRADDPRGQALFERLTLGKPIDLRVDGVVAKKSGAWKIAGAGTDNEREVVTGSVAVKIETIHLLSPEDLG